MSEQSKDSSVFGIVNMESVQIPPRNYLISLPPIGIGTAEVECLSSYISRLAWEYFVSPQKLLKTCVEKYHYSSTHYFYDSSRLFYKQINGSGEAAKIAVSSIEKATNRQDIVQMTMLQWRELLCQKFMRRNRAWCPMCFQSDLQNKIPVYERLLWRINVVDNCIIHKQKLVEVCPSCERKQTNFLSRVFPGFCGKCSNWLGKTKPFQSEINTLDDQVSFEIGKIVSTSPKVRSEVRSRLIFADALGYLVNKSPFSSYPSMLRMTGVYVVHLLYSEKKPSLISLVKINRVFNCSIVDLLLGGKFTLILKSKNYGDLVIEIDPHQMPKPLPIKDVLVTMEKHLASRFLTHETYTIAKIVNHDFEAPSIISPELYRSLDRVYSKERRRYDEQEYEEISERVYLENVKKHNLLVEILKILKQLKIEGIEITEKGIRARLGNKTENISSRKFWIILRIAMYELGYMNE
jgi:TniQ